MREEISCGIAAYITWNNDKPNWSKEALHNFDSCLCDRGKAGKAKKAVANEKRRAYYKTAAGIETKKTIFTALFLSTAQYMTEIFFFLSIFPT